MKKELKKIAKQLVELEKQSQENPTDYTLGKMMAITKNLSLKDMIEIDAYIQENHLLTD